MFKANRFHRLGFGCGPNLSVPELRNSDRHGRALVRTFIGMSSIEIARSMRGPSLVAQEILVVIAATLGWVTTRLSTA